MIQVDPSGSPAGASGCPVEYGSARVCAARITHHQPALLNRVLYLCCLHSTYSEGLCQLTNQAGVRVVCVCRQKNTCFVNIERQMSAHTVCVCVCVCVCACVFVCARVCVHVPSSGLALAVYVPQDKCQHMACWRVGARTWRVAAIGSVRI